MATPRDASIDSSETSQTRSETSYTDRNYVSFADDLFLDTAHSRLSNGKNRISDVSFAPEDLLDMRGSHNRGNKMCKSSHSPEELLGTNTNHNRNGGRVSDASYSIEDLLQGTDSPTCRQEVSFAPQESSKASMHASKVTFADDLEIEPLTNRAKMLRRQRPSENASSRVIPSIRNIIRSISDDSRASTTSTSRRSRSYEDSC